MAQSRAGRQVTTTYERIPDRNLAVTFRFFEGTDTSVCSMMRYTCCQEYNSSEYFRKGAPADLWMRMLLKYETHRMCGGAAHPRLAGKSVLARPQ